MFKGKRWLVWLLGSIGLLFLTGVGAVTYFAYSFFDVGRTAATAEHWAARYKAAGMPWEATDLKPFLPTNPANNAAPLLKRIIASCQPKSITAERREIGQLLFERKLHEVALRLKRFDPALDAAFRASRKTGLDFARDWDLGPSLEMPEFGEVKGLIHGLCLRARLSAASGNAGDCIEQLRAARDLSELIGTEPTLISMLVGLAGRRITYDAVRRCASEFARNPKALESLRLMLGKEGTEPNFHYALRGEAYMGLTTCRNLELYRESGEGDIIGSSVDSARSSDLQRTGLPEDTAARAFIARHMRMWSETGEAMKRHPNDADAVASEMDRIARKYEGDWSLSSGLDIVLYPLFSEATDAIRVCRADRVVTDALLSALIVRARTGNLPTGIGQLPNAKLDPFSKKPLLLKTDGQAIRIYSVGRNRQDDGGIEQREIPSGPSDRTKFDIVAAYPPIRAK